VAAAIAESEVEGDPAAFPLDAGEPQPAGAGCDAGQGLEEITNRRIQKNAGRGRSEEHTSELQSRFDLVCRLLLEKKKTNIRSLVALASYAAASAACVVKAWPIASSGARRFTGRAGRRRWSRSSVCTRTRRSPSTR